MNLRFGILGAGGISTRFATVLNTVEGVELEAVAARDLERARAFARTFHAEKALDDYRDLIRDETVDAVYIGLLNDRHYEMVRFALEQHKAVLCEKPMVTTRREAEELAQLAQEQHTLLMEAMWTRCQPAYQAARHWVQAGAIGELMYITANFCHTLPYDPQNRFYDPQLGGGSLFDLGVYGIEFCTGMVGENPQSVSGLATITATGVDAAAAFALGFAGGCLANLACSFTFDASERVVLYGSAGRIELDQGFGPRCIQRFDAAGRLVESFCGPEGDGFVHQIRHFAGLYQQGKTESDLIPLRDTIACAGVFDQLRKQWGLI